MKTLLVLAQHPELADVIRRDLNPEQYRIVHRANFEEAEPLLAHGLAQACVLDMELAGVQEIWQLEKVRRRAPKCPILVFAGPKHLEWEEEAYLKGATYVLSKPVRARMLSALLDRLWLAPVAAPAPAPQSVPAAEPARMVEPSPSAIPSLPLGSQNLGVLRGFSSILTHSLDSEAMLRRFLLQLREHLGINRAAIFLREPTRCFGEWITSEESRRMRSACAMGLPASLLEHFELSFDTGIGGQMSRLERGSPARSGDAERIRAARHTGGRADS
jgi:CheY-like chemotaxis protein